MSDIQVKLTVKEAHELSMALSDILCWIRGFRAGREGSGSDNGPISSEYALRKFNLKLIRAYQPSIKFGRSNV